MTTLTLYKANTGHLDSYSLYDNINFDLTTTSWYLLDDTQKVVYGALYGNNLTYDVRDSPVLGSITSASSFDKQGALQWAISNIGIASNDTYNLKSALASGDPFDRHINTFLSGDDNIIGSSGNDIIYLSEGVDTIDGGAGSDWLDASSLYLYYSSTFTIDLNSKTYSKISNNTPTILGHFSNMENIIGSSNDDTLLGDANNNMFEGGRGNDLIKGGAGTDTVSYKNAGSIIVDLITGITIEQWDLYGYSTYADTLYGIENIIGSIGNDTLAGDAFNNQLTGGVGNDTLNGGSGTDTVIFANAYRAVRVNLVKGTASGEGTDTLSNIENIIGSGYDDSLTGSSSANVLSGNAGNDTLTGGLGRDTFVFNTAVAANNDKITDFSVTDDTIQLENAIFTKLMKTGTLDTAYLKIGAVAADRNDYMIYNKTTGALLYDADGSGAVAAIQIAKLGVNIALTNADFIVI